MKRKNKEKFDPEFIKKAARLLKGEKLSDSELQAYQLHGHVVKHYKRLKISVEKKNDQWSMDLGEMNDLAPYNYGYRYLFCVLDIYSRYAFVRLLKNKSAKNVATKFQNILSDSGQVPKKIQCDEGTEFQKIRKEISKDNNFIVFHTFNREIKASHAERFIQTLKLMIRRTLTTINSTREKPTYKYVDFLPYIVDRYNNAPHRGIYGLTPHQVYFGKKKISQEKEYKSILKGAKVEKNLLKPNDKVRIVRTKSHIFEKASLQAWVKEIFRVDKVLPYTPVVYKLKSLKGERIKGKFYRDDLKKIK